MNEIFCLNKSYAANVLTSVDGVVYGISAGNEPIPFSTILLTNEIDAETAVTSDELPLVPEVY